MHLLLIGLLIGFVMYPVGRVLLGKLKDKVENIDVDD